MSNHKHKKKVLLTLSVTFLTAAVILIAYSVYQIVGSQIRAKERMAEWEAYLSQMSQSSEPEPTAIPSDIPASSAESSSEASSAAATPTPTPSAPAYVPELLGTITFPTINNRTVVVVNGTTKADLRGAAGRATYSANPGDIGNCIVFGHRDGVFKGFDKLSVGDEIRFKTVTDEFTYKIVSMTIGNPNDSLIHIKYMDKAVLTLVTCYPFNYVGAAPFRYIVITELVE